MRKIAGGIYLIADAAMEKKLLLGKLTKALESGISVLQLYNTEGEPDHIIENVNEICALCRQYNVPVLVNNNWGLLNSTLADGVHFDQKPEDLEQIKEKLDRDFISGITCSNDLSTVSWADEKGLDYISFCSMFPSPSAGQCEIVSFETVRKAREITNIPLFVAGGIDLENIENLKDLPLQGVAVISGIMSADDIPASTKNFIEKLEKITK